MKHKYNEGSSLIEVLVAIVILALIVVPTCTSLVMSARINAKAEELLQDQLAVSSAVETLMAEKISNAEIDPDTYNVDTIAVTSEGVYYTVTVTKGDVTVTTKIGGGT